MSSNDDSAIKGRICDVCGGGYFGTKGHVSCPGNKKRIENIEPVTVHSIVNERRLCEFAQATINKLLARKKKKRLSSSSLVSCKLCRVLMSQL